VRTILFWQTNVGYGSDAPALVVLATPERQRGERGAGRVRGSRRTGMLARPMLTSPGMGTRDMEGSA
jgi:hypothetical protein